MKDHPMLLMRDPPPEIDVTRPALPKRIRLADLSGGVTSETVDNTGLLRGLVSAYTFSYDAQGNMRVQTVTAAELYKEPAAQAAPEAEDESGPSQVAEPVAAAPFKAGDPVMWHYAGCVEEWRTGIYAVACSSNIVCRRPTDAELAEHWGEVKP